MGRLEQIGLSAIGTVLGLGIWKTGGWAWAQWGWVMLVPFAGAMGLLVVLNLVNLAKFWIDGWRGLDQWPHPHGRYYSEWMRLPVGHYYDWLALKMGSREPWRTWAAWARSMETSLDDDEEG